MKKVIVNGDDFGMNERCSRAIAQAFSLGLITDTTAVANGAYFNAAIALAAQQGFSDRIGIHFNLTEGEPLTQEIRSIPDFVRDSCFHKQFIHLPRPLNEDERHAVYTELTAQVERLGKAGVRIIHADSHHYIHNIPYLAPIVAQVCRENGIGKIRLQRNFGGAVGCEANNRFWREQGFLTTEHFGRMSDIAHAGIPDDIEIMVHPDFNKNGVLIDRHGLEDGFPVGDPLSDLSKEKNVALHSYRDLK